MSSPTKKIHVIAVVLLASMLIGADDCGLSSCGTNADPPPCGQVLIGVGGDTGMGGDTGIGGVGDSDTGAGGSNDPGDPAPESLTCVDGSEMGTYIRCRGIGSTACAAQCNAIGAYCVELATHPENPSIGVGALKQCMSNTFSSTCTYCYSNGDVCTFICVNKGCGVGRCTNTGGKGCE